MNFLYGNKKRPIFYSWGGSLMEYDPLNTFYLLPGYNRRGVDKVTRNHGILMISLPDGFVYADQKGQFLKVIKKG